MTENVSLAVVGATGAVGGRMLEVLAERSFPVTDLYALASGRSAGRRLRFRDREIEVLDIEEFDFSEVSIALFTAGAAVSEAYVPRAVEAGSVVIDNTSHFRYHDDVPLIVPEVNAQAIAGYRKIGVVANPNCSTVQMVVALKPLHDKFRITRINVATYQSVSGTGQDAIREMLEHSRAVLDGKQVVPEVYPKVIAFNVLPHIDVFMDNGYTKEEMKMVWETCKIFADDTIRVNPTTVRVPVVYGHSEAVHVEFADDFDVDEVRGLLSQAPGVVVIDEPKDGGYPTAVTEAAGNDQVFVGRIRRDISHPRGLDLWIVSDNLRKGAATNSVQIAEILLRDYL